MCSKIQRMVSVEWLRFFCRIWNCLVSYKRGGVAECRLRGFTGFSSCFLRSHCGALQRDPLKDFFAAASNTIVDSLGVLVIGVCRRKNGNTSFCFSRAV